MNADETKKNILLKLAEDIRDEYKIGANTAYRVGSALAAIVNAFPEKNELGKFFLRKDQADSTEHLVSFLAGLNIGAKYSIDEDGNASLNDIKANVVEGITALFNQIEATQLNATQADINTLTAFTLLVKSLADVGNLNVKDTATVLNAVVKQSLTSPKFVSGFLGEGFRLAKTESGDWNLEIDNLIVRKVFQVFELLIQEVKHQGGVIVHSPAGGKITKVTDGGSYWRCEIESADTFFKDDLVLCQKFTGKVKRYWRLATSAGDGFVNLSKTDCEANSAIPEEGDEIATLGNKTNVDRQSAYLISVVGADAPYTAYYSGINSYSLKGKEHTRIGNLEGVVSPVFGPLKGSGAVLENAYVQGMIKLQNGKSVETVISETSSKLSSDIGKVQTDLQKDINTSVSSVKNELGATITNVENSFNTSLNSTKNELNSSISKVQGDANAAKGLAQSAQDSIDGLEIGGKNLIIRHNERKGWLINPDGVEAPYQTSALMEGRIPVSFGDKLVFQTIKEQEKGDNYWRYAYYNDDDIVVKRYANSSRLFYQNVPAGATYMKVSYPKDGVVKLEKGNKPTDWTPAPEDYEAQISKSKEEAEAAAKAYADAQDNLKQIESKAYADGKITAEEQRAIEDAKAKLEAAKKYADAQDALLKTQQEAYADGIVTEAEQRAINEAQDRLDKAKEELNALIEGVKESVTKEIKDVEQRFEIADGQINSHIKETTQLVTEAKLANGESIKTLEQVKVQINDINVTAGQINSTLGEVTKKQGEINSSISNLEQTAGSIKTSIEGFKETEAEIKATANKIEATHEGIVLEASEKSAQKAIDGLEVGGKNLIIRHNERKGWLINPDGVEAPYQTSALMEGRIPVSFGDKLVFQTIKEQEKGDNYWRYAYYNDDDIVVKRYANSSRLFYQNVPAGATYMKVSYPKDGVIKLERGTKPTDWTPAPEDTEAQITETNAKLGVLNDKLIAEVSKTDGINRELAAVKLDHNSFKVQVKTDITGAINSNNEVIKSSFEMKDNIISMMGKEVNILAELKVGTNTLIKDGFINTLLLKANSITADKLNVGSLLARHLRTADAGPRIEATGSEMKIYGIGEHPNIVLGVNTQGYAVLAYYSNDGQLIYDLGPRGINWGSIKPESWTETKLVGPITSGDDPKFFDFNMYTNTDSYRGHTYYRYFAGSNPTITAKEKEKENYIYTMKGNFNSKISDGWYMMEGTPGMSIAGNTTAFVRPFGEDGIYQWGTGVRDIPPIYFRMVMQYKGGQIYKTKYVCWNGPSDTSGGMFPPNSGIIV